LFFTVFSLKILSFPWWRTWTNWTIFIWRHFYQIILVFFNLAIFTLYVSPGFS